MKKIFYLSILLIVLASACTKSTSSKETYTPEFYDPLPFDGMKGNVECVKSKIWVIHNINDKQNQQLQSEHITYYATDGSIESKVRSTYHYNAPDLTTFVEDIYKDHKLAETNLLIGEKDNPGSKSNIRYLNENKNKVYGHLKGIVYETKEETDTVRLIIEYDFNNQTKKTTTLIDQNRSEIETVYYKNNLPQIQTYIYIDHQDTLSSEYLFTYDQENRIISRLERTIGISNQGRNITFEYTKNDEQNNWTEKEQYISGTLSRIEKREITYRK